MGKVICNKAWDCPIAENEGCIHAVEHCHTEQCIQGYCYADDDIKHRPCVKVEAARTKPPRKIIQISGVAFGVNLLLYALCDDGSVWVESDRTDEWRKVPDIPQDKQGGEQ